MGFMSAKSSSGVFVPYGKFSASFLKSISIFGIPAIIAFAILMPPMPESKKPMFMLSQRPGSNRRPPLYESGALPTELLWQKQTHFIRKMLKDKELSFTLFHFL